MQRVHFAGVFAFLSVVLWIGSGEPARGQDRGGAAGAIQAPPPPPPPGGVGQPPPPPPLGGVIPAPVAGNLGIGVIPVTPPAPIGYFARPPADYNLGRFFYYPYYYFPHNYWPTETCQWPERPGQPYMRPPAYMTYPPFLEPHWRYEWWSPQRYYRGFHFWLDQF